ncbi:MAG: hypothetical protein J1G38_04355 [Clostridiales bacterium]|nr:hypothetical protein [Clostridiales bacterium]
MFYSFEKEDILKASAYIEIRYCKLKPKASIKKIVSTRSIKPWEEDSLYAHVDDIVSDYADIFCGGVYNNLKTGPVDLYGINYYSPDLLKVIIDKIEKRKPLDYEALLAWLKAGEKYNGIYVLGI